VKFFGVYLVLVCCLGFFVFWCSWVAFYTVVGGVLVRTGFGGRGER